MTVHHLRRNYTYGSLSRADLPNDPMSLFHQWFSELQASELPEWFEVNAMTLSTSLESGGAASRIVLLKGIEPDGFLFFTNYDSHKGEQMARDPKVALNFYWPVNDRQVRITGIVEKTASDISDQYFQSRPRSSQLGAIASRQSSIVHDHVALEEAVQKLDEQFANQPVPRPEIWGGYRVRPTSIEFWQGRPSRLHDRFLYLRQPDASWTIDRLAP